MKQKIYDWIFRTVLGRFDGYKTYIGSIIMILVSIMSIVTVLIGLLPDVAILAQIQVFLIKAKTFLETIEAGNIGAFFLGAGLVDKFAKGELQTPVKA